MLCPLRLPDNRVPVYYEGGAGIDRFRGQPRGTSGGPEDWVASMCRLPASIVGPDGPLDAGLSTTLDGRRAARPGAGPTRSDGSGAPLAERFGGDSGLLVKLLDAGERLPVHCHPTRSFGADHLGSLFGKTEGWIIMDAAPGATVWLGLSDDVDVATLRRWVDRQDVSSMLGGDERDRGHRRAGGVRARRPAPLDRARGAADRVAGTDVVLGARRARVVRSRRAAGDARSRLGRGARVLRSRRLPRRPAGGVAARAGRALGAAGRDRGRSVPGGGRRVLRRPAVRCTSTVTLDEAGFAVLVVTGGSGRIVWDDGDAAVARGDTWVVPAAAGPLRFTGELEAIVCLPPRDGAVAR